MVHFPFHFNPGLPMFTVVLLWDDDTDDVCVISRDWISLDESQASIPNILSYRFHRMIRNYASVPERNSITTDTCDNSQRLVIDQGHFD